MFVKLRELKPKDAEFMLEWMREPEINKFFRFEATNMTLEKCLDFIVHSCNDPTNKHFAIVDDDDEYQGTISLKNITDKDAEYAISTRIKAHGTGLALEATKLLLDYAFNDLRLENVYLNVLTENVQANAFYKKAGFIFSHLEKDAVEIRGEKKDLNWYYIHR